MKRFNEGHPCMCKDCLPAFNIVDELYVFYLVRETNTFNHFPQQFVVMSDGNVFWRLGVNSELISPFQFASGYSGGRFEYQRVRYWIDERMILSGFDIGKKWYEEYKARQIDKQQGR